MKKAVIIIILLLLIFFGIQYGPFLWKNFSGVGPSLKTPTKDITQLIPKPIQNDTNPGENKTTLPIHIPNGFTLSIFADNLTNPRVLTQDPNGNLVVSITGQGRVMILPDLNHDGIADEPLTLVDNLNQPHGLAFRCPSASSNCQLYVAETDKVDVFDYDVKNLRVSNKRKIIDLPGGGRHFSRTLLYDPQKDKLFITVGSSCDTCIEKDNRRTKVLVADPDGANLKTYASGLRNAVFITSHPLTKDLWVTEMGRDFLGDETPPDEINVIQEGKDYGWPYCYGKKIVDKSFDANHSCENTEPSYIDIPAHSAPLGLAFFPKDGWPQNYQNNLLVAYHGSWNRSVPTGYKVVRYNLDNQGKYISEEDFMSGWLQNDGSALGRPAGILITDKGSLYISDDKAGVIYLMRYSPQ